MANGKRPDAAHIMKLAENLAMAVGTGAYINAHMELEAAVYSALHTPTAAQLVRQGLESSPAMVHSELKRAMDLVRRAAERIRCLHAELSLAEAALAMAEDPTPPGAIHGTTAANVGSVQVAA